jgi:alkane 1-monooxygenase
MGITKKLGFLFSYSIPLLILLGYYLPDSPITFLTAPYAYLLVPIIDIVLGNDRNNVIKEDFDSLLHQKYFNFLVYSHVYIQYFLLAWGCYVLSIAELTGFQTFGIFVSQGIYSGTIINVAHELGHRKSKLAEWHSKLALISVVYYHFYVEHNKGHHVHVATPKDPATAIKNQNIYAFWFQAVVGSFRSAWQIEKIQNERIGESSRLSNQVLWGLVSSLVLFALLIGVFTQYFGAEALLTVKFLLVQSVMAILLLETVNYVEHYGIQRREISPNRYEKVNPLHSWNANHFFSNLLLFNLQRHSDHHAYASRPYQVLRHFDESPQLPFGYPLMVLMALFPPLWFVIMNKKLESWQLNAYDSEHIKHVIRQLT